MIFLGLVLFFGVFAIAVKLGVWSIGGAAAIAVIMVAFKIAWVVMCLRDSGRN
jgi:hypothetical protein